MKTKNKDSSKFSDVKVLLKKEITIPLLIFVFTLIVYIHNLSPGVYGGDSGDILTSAAIWGVPHPPGYPLITFLGGLFVHFLPFGITPAWKFGFLSAIISSVAVIFVYKTVYLILKDKFLSTVTALTLAFTFPFWLYSEIVEVIALHNFFIILLIYLTVKYIQKNTNKTLYTIAFFAGLSLSNNQTILLLFPAIAFSIIFANKKILFEFRTILTALCFFLLGLVPYIYIPIAASKFPEINNGVAVNLHNFTYLVMRRYYGWGKINSDLVNSQILLPNFISYLKYWIVYMNPFVIFFSLSGILTLFKKKLYSVSLLFIVAYLFLGPFFVYYSKVNFTSVGYIAVVEKFYAQSIIISLFFMPFGLVLWKNIALQKLNNPFLKKTAAILIIIITVLLPSSFFINNFKKTNLRNVYLVDNFAKDILKNVAPNSILLLSDDTAIYSSLYEKYVYNFRNDVSLPGIHDGFKSLIKFINNDPKFVSEYQEKHMNIMPNETIAEVVPKMISNNNVYTIEPLNFDGVSTGEIINIPYGILYKLERAENFKDSETQYIMESKKIFNNYQLDYFAKNKFLISNQLYLADIRDAYVLGLINTAIFIKKHYQDTDAASIFLSKAIEIDPNSYYLNKLNNN